MAHDNRVEMHKEPPRLTVKQLTKDDRGMYQCFASNSWDQVQATSELDMGDAGPELVYWFVYFYQGHPVCIVPFYPFGVGESYFFILIKFPIKQL